MSKGRGAPPLFELLDRGDRFGDDVLHGRSSQETETASSCSTRTPFRPAPLRIGPRSFGDATGAPEASPDRPVRWLEIDRGGARIRLKTKGLGIAVVICVILLTVVLETGYRIGIRDGLRTGQPSFSAAIDEVDRVRNQPPQSELIAPLLVSGGAPGPKASTHSDTPRRPAENSAAWSKGMTYLVVQEFPAGGVEDARSARDFLADHGVTAQVVGFSGGSSRLIAQPGFNLKEPAQKRMAEELKTTVHAIGEKYFAAGGRYRMKGYLKTLTTENW